MRNKSRQHQLQPKTFEESGCAEDKGMNIQCTQAKLFGTIEHQVNGEEEQTSAEHSPLPSDLEHLFDRPDSLPSDFKSMSNQPTHSTKLSDAEYFFAQKSSSAQEIASKTLTSRSGCQKERSKGSFTSAQS